MIIDCLYCDRAVEGVFQGEYTWSPHIPDEPPWPVKISMYSCPTCKAGVVVEQEELADPDGIGVWTDPERVWPKPQQALSYLLPKDVRHSLDEARKCFKAKAYDACAVMCRRALEATSQAFGVGGMAAAALRELRDKGIIDSRIYEWGEALRKQGNISAHASGEHTPRVDAADILEFAESIGEYIFVLKRKFELFKRRRDKAPQTSTTERVGDLPE